MTPQEFSAKIKAKHPAYANVDDIELARRVVEKYPVYSEQVDFGMPDQSGESFAESIPVGIGSLVGSAAGSLLPTPARATLAGIGGAGAQAIQDIYGWTQGEPMPTSTEEATRLGQTFATQAGLEAALPATMKYAGMAAKRYAPGMVSMASKAATGLGDVGAQLMRAGSATQEKYGSAIMQKPSILFEAHMPETMREAYGSFQRYTGLRGLGEYIESQGRATMPAGQLEELVVGASQALERGEQLGAQDLFYASQAGNHLKLAAKYGDPQAAQALESGIIKKSTDKVNKALENIYPEYKNLRTEFFESKAREQVSSILPLNKNLSPNVLRTWSAGAVAAEGLRRGNPLWAMALPAVSPMAWGTGIRSAYLGAQVAPRALADYYNSGKKAP